MEIRIYDKDMEFQGIIENQRSLLWNRKYYEAGDFEMHCPITPYNISLLKRGNLVWKRGAIEAGIIENLRIEEDYDGNEIAVIGRFLPCLFDRRLLKGTTTFSAEFAEIVLRSFCMNAYEENPIIRPEIPHGFPEKISLQVTYKNALASMIKVAKQSQLGFRVVPDFNAKSMQFQVYKGVDRSMAQSDRARVIFSEEYSNLNRATFEENEQVYRNICYVGGQGEGDERTIVVVGDTGATGFERREVFVNGQDISKDGISDAEYLEALKQRGNDKLAENLLYQSLECEAIPYGNFEYGVDYDLGDIVTIKKESWDVGENLRLTGINEVYEDGARKIQPTFGEPIPIIADWKED